VKRASIQDFVSSHADLSVQTGAGERIGDLPLAAKVRSKVNCKDHLPDKPVAHREQAPEAIRILPALMPAPQPWRLALVRRLRCALSSSGE
jgi:hypothetical protein